LAVNPEIIAISRALLSLSAAVMETRHALLRLTPPQGEEFAKYLQSSDAAMVQCLEHIKKLLDLIENSGE
jgi:hypothetical protein